MSTQPYVRRLQWLGVSLEKSTPAVPDDGRYYVLRGAEVFHASESLTIAQAYYELLQEEERAAHPELFDPRSVIAKEQAFHDILSARGEARQRARSQQQAKGGPGGRSGV